MDYKFTELTSASNRMYKKGNSSSLFKVKVSIIHLLRPHVGEHEQVHTIDANQPDLEYISLKGKTGSRIVHLLCQFGLLPSKGTHVTPPIE